MSDVYFCIKDNYIQLISSQLLIDVYMQKFWFQNTRKCVSLLYIVLVWKTTIFMEHWKIYPL